MKHNEKWNMDGPQEVNLMSNVLDGLELGLDSNK